MLTYKDTDIPKTQTLRVWARFYLIEKLMDMPIKSQKIDSLSNKSDICLIMATIFSSLAAKRLSFL